MPPSRRSSPHSSDFSSPFDVLDDLIGEINATSTTPAQPPASAATLRELSVSTTESLSSPRPQALRSTSSRSEGGTSRITGYLQGKESLFRIDDVKRGRLCAGYLGGKDGGHTRFCLREVDGFMKFCKSHSGEKFPYQTKAYYIPMKNESALCSPCVTLKQLSDNQATGLVTKRHSSREWVEILNAFHTRFGSSSGETAPTSVARGAGDAFDEDEEMEEVVVDDGGDLEGDSKPLASGDRDDVMGTEVEFERGEGRCAQAVAGAMDVLRSVKMEVVTAEGEFKTDGNTWISGLTSVVESVLTTIPKELDRMDRKLEAFSDRTESKISGLVVDHENFCTDLYGDEDEGQFVAEHQSFARATAMLFAELQALKDRVTQNFNLANSASIIADEAKSDSEFLAATWKSSAEKMAEVIRALTSRFERKVAELTQHGPRNRTGEVPLKDQPFFAAYAHKDTNRVSIGLSKEEYRRYNKHGHNVCKVFDNEPDLTSWFAAHGPTIGDLYDNPVASPAPSPGDELVSDSPQGGSAAQISDLLSAVEALQVANASLQSDLVELKRVAFSKNIKVGEFSFDSEDDIVAMLEEDGVPLNAFGLAVDANSFFAHHHDGSVDDSRVSNEMKTMRLAGVHDAVSLRHINSFRQLHPPYFLNASNMKVNEGDRFPMFENAVAWEGRSSVTGGRRILEKTLLDTQKSISNYIDQHVDKTSRSSRLFHLLATETLNWWTKLIAHFNHELQAVQQYGIPEKETYTLVSNELNKMFQAMWEKRMLMQEFSTDCDQRLFLARTIWITMQAHMVMTEFAEPAFETHTLISSIFIRFLAEETGSNFSSGLSTTITELKEQISAVDSLQTKKAKAISQRLDSVSETVRKLCSKADVKFASKGSD